MNSKCYRLSAEECHRIWQSQGYDCKCYSLNRSEDGNHARLDTGTSGFCDPSASMALVSLVAALTSSSIAASSPAGSLLASGWESLRPRARLWRGRCAVLAFLGPILPEKKFREARCKSGAATLVPFPLEFLFFNLAPPLDVSPFSLSLLLPCP